MVFGFGTVRFGSVRLVGWLLGGSGSLACLTLIHYSLINSRHTNSQLDTIIKCMKWIFVINAWMDTWTNRELSLGE